jgi:urease accessory protein
MTEPALAHTGPGPGFGFSSGFQHPLGGIDHLLAMFAVGLLAVQLGGRSIWLVPGAFVAAMTLGALIGFTGVQIPLSEFAIVASMVAIALPVALAIGMPPLVAMIYVGFFALFHGHVHGVEIPAATDPAAYLLGFTVATAAVHGCGVAFGLFASRPWGSVLLTRLTAAGIAAVGLVLIVS